MDEPTEIASLPSRALAALIDYIVLTAFFVLAVRLIPNPDYSFLASLLTGLIYFSLVHSSLTKGQSLGKKAFGLRVLRCDGSDELFLTPTQAAFRYLNSLGWVILLTEAPPIIFRLTGTIASPAVLEAHMLLVMSYFICNIACLIADPRHRAIHDLFAKTCVIRGEPVRIDRESIRSPRRTIGIAAGLAIAVCLWLFGLSPDPSVQALSSHRYELENRFPVRLVAVSFPPEELSLDLLLVQSGTPDLNQLATQLAQYLQSREEIFADSRFKKVLFTFYFNPADSDGEAPPQTVELELPSLQPIPHP